MKFRVYEYPISNIDAFNGTTLPVTIETGMCKSNGVILGQPCSYSQGLLTITLNRASEYKILRVYDNTVSYTVYFASKCQFPAPKEGDVVVVPSMPLYRFLKGGSQVQIEFAVFGTKQTSHIQFRKGNALLCSWNGSVVSSNNPGCKDLNIDEAHNWMAIKPTIFHEKGKDYETCSWGSGSSNLSVTIDWSREGEAPEVAECNGIINSVSNLHDNMLHLKESGSIHSQVKRIHLPDKHFNLA
uniref:DUF5727 domain-containing protein n=1 Tax=Echinococcus canadensis TaxID=519352 RepID=A0A915EXJ8_9CEST